MNPDYLVEEDISRAIDLLRAARHAVALTGAGISTPSNIPDFRSQGTGLWRKDDPMQVASLSAFRYRPQSFFDWFRPLAKRIWVAEPNPAHRALAQLERAGRLKAVITQNIDGLHQKAGSHSVIELHGSASHLACPACHRRYPAEEFRVSFLEEGSFPTCPACGAVLKPDIVLFEEMLPADAWNQAQSHCEQADVILVVGSSLEVMPANSLPLYALQGGARLIIANYTPTHLDRYADVLLPNDVVDTLPKIAAAVQ